MKTLLFLFSITLSLQTFGYQFRSQITTSPSDEIVKRLILTCKAEETICQEICSIRKGCILNETLCEDCATQQSQVLHTLFTDITSVFRTDVMFVDNKLIAEFFKRKKFMTISYDSFLNYFNPEKKSEIKATFESLCYVPVNDATILTVISDTNNLEEVIGMICHDTDRNAVILPIEMNLNFSNKNLDFWQKLNVESGFPIKGIDLKVSAKINSSN
ncbi:MAG: hypothetical protein WA160_12660 [Pseudobdellovibrio sp.]